MDARISTGLPGHPKTKKLARRLGAEGPLGCIYLFLWTAANRSNGDLSGMTDEDIELAIDWAGDEGAFVAAMAEVGFLEGEPDARRIHDWAEHNPWAAGAEARSEKSRWAALCKQHGRKEAAKLMPEYAARIAEASESDAGSKPDALPKSATGTPLAETGTAPSPCLSVSLPSPSPSPNQEQVEPPADADVTPADPKPKKPKRAEITLTAFAEQCREAGEAVIPEDDAVFAYAEKVGLPDEYVGLAWTWFKAKYTDGSGKAKRYADWRATFRNAVKDCWPKFWAIGQGGEFYLTTAGKQAQLEAQA